ncbi:hypothetical protein FisN_1Lh083 [Fistulifera solaris]|uniref:BolA protein n=1 Tax=Fistulifera solaris TaxID=1519565 RepID=A0A1Z5K4T8_FISSO|nr:hypothetical protein FisN_1Lh083 [Fistulifera solaris]|eukprot:GAX21254.1 hypothetical protein FisN_1Lh083 [Fistulifera solaris]
MYKLWLLLTTMISFRAAQSFSVLRHHTPAPMLHAKASFRLFSVSGEAGTSLVDICHKKIQDALQADSVKVTGAYDDPNGSHISIEVVSSMFVGKRAVQRQQLVYKAIWEELQGPVHAVDSMVCKTPDE